VIRGWDLSPTPLSPQVYFKEISLKFLLGFEEISRASLPQVGGKNASLGEMLRAGFRVPPGFAVTTDSYLKFITETGIKDEIFSTLATVNPKDTASLDRASAKIRDLVESVSILAEIQDGIEGAYTLLGEKCGVREVPVAVRSSATAEDLPTASFAGQQDTYLWVRGVGEVVRTVRQCWGSLFTPRAISYRTKMNFPHEKVLISVGIQKMVNAKTAGVMFTLNPLNGDVSRVVIEANWGLGETVVSGAGTPDRFAVDKVVFEINERTISPKTIQCVYTPEKGVIHCDIPLERQNTPCLDDNEIRELVKVAKRIEEHYGSPQDIEWAIDKDFPFPENIFIVQSRPETVWSPRPKEPVLGKKSGFELLMERALTHIKVKL
jgi:pyruvate,water dikinase